MGSATQLSSPPSSGRRVALAPRGPRSRPRPASRSDDWRPDARVLPNQNTEILVSTSPLKRNGVGQHHVERRQPVGGDDEQMIGIDIVNVAHLPLVNPAQTADLRLSNNGGDCENGSMYGCGLLPLRSGRSAIVAGRSHRSTRMAWKGTFFGALVGLLVTRTVWGAVVGAIIGQMFDQSARFSAGADPRTRPRPASVPESFLPHDVRAHGARRQIRRTGVGGGNRCGARGSCKNCAWVPAMIERRDRVF